jgi:UDP-N-acetylglucosamine 4-epimerase
VEDFKMENQNIFHTEDLSSKSFLITGGAGFIGSNIVEYLIKHNAKKIRILDNLSTGNLNNIKDFLKLPNVEFIQGDIRFLEDCKIALKGIEYVSHQAALGSVPRSINDPITTNEVNISGFLNILYTAKEEGVKKLVYAASSSTYGDSPSLPKKEDIIGMPLSPYAVTKYLNELYAHVFSLCYDFHTIGLRYFNVYGPKQNPDGDYAAVIPKFIKAAYKKQDIYINGKGDTSRDFTYISNVVQANIKSLLNTKSLNHSVYNIACGQQTNLLELLDAINENLSTKIKPIFKTSRKGDVKHSLADIKKAEIELEYKPIVYFNEGIKKTINFYTKNQNYF